MIIRLAAYLRGVLRSGECKDPPATVPEPDSGQCVYREAWNALCGESMRARYPSLSALWSEHGGTVDENDLRAVYDTDRVIIDDDAQAPFEGFSNAQKMYYKIARCHEEAVRARDDFDLMIRMRPDFEFSADCSFDWHALHQASVEERLVYWGYYARYFFLQIGSCPSDQFAIGSQEAMSAYAAAYAMTIAAGSTEAPRLKGFPIGFISHRSVAYSTLYQGIGIEAEKFSAWRMMPTFRPTGAALREALAADSVNRMDRFDQMLMQALDHGIA